MPEVVIAQAAILGGFTTSLLGRTKFCPSEDNTSLVMTLHCFAHEKNEQRRSKNRASSELHIICKVPHITAQRQHAISHYGSFAHPQAPHQLCAISPAAPATSQSAFAGPIVEAAKACTGGKRKPMTASTASTPSTISIHSASTFTFSPLAVA